MEKLLQREKTEGRGFKRVGSLEKIRLQGRRKQKLLRETSEKKGSCRGEQSDGKQKMGKVMRRQMVSNPISKAAYITKTAFMGRENKCGK